MPAPRKYDQETRDRAVRIYRDRRREKPAESALAARRRVGELLDVKAETLRCWVERAEVDAGERPGLPSAVEARIAELERENYEPAINRMSPSEVHAPNRAGGNTPQAIEVTGGNEPYRHRRTSQTLSLAQGLQER